MPTLNAERLKEIREYVAAGFFNRPTGTDAITDRLLDMARDLLAHADATSRFLKARTAFDYAGIAMEVDDSLPPDVMEIRDRATGKVLTRVEGIGPRMRHDLKMEAAERLARLVRHKNSMLEMEGDAVLVSIDDWIEMVAEARRVLRE